MSAVLNFDASQVAPDTGSQDALPAGWYQAMMEASEMKPTKNNAVDGGMFLECKFNVIAPPQHAGKKFYSRLNLRNSNPTAQEIGYKQLSAICHAVGVLQVADSAQLHNIPLHAKLKLRKPDGDYEASNEVSAYKSVTEQVQLVGSAPVGAVAGFPATPGMMPPAATPQFAPPPPAAAPAAPQWQAPVGGQPWAQAPQAAPAAPAPQMMPPQQSPAPAPAAQWQPPAQPAPAPAQAAPQWQAPAGGQPWAQAPQAAPAPQAPQAPQAAPAGAAHPAQQQTPPWMQQPGQA